MDDKKIVLAIDDNAQQLREFKAILVPRYDLRVVKAASDAMSFLNGSTRADVILLDIEMPNISGFEFLEDIKKMPSYMHVPVIIVSGNTGTDFLHKARNSKATDVLTKPVKSDRLFEVIEKALAMNI